MVNASDLKKVTPNMQTHKNTDLKQTGATPHKGSTNYGAAGAQMDKPPQFAKEGKKWIIVNKNSICMICIYR